jgi:predicted DCC family thiol-disulfide oxidoreductase YuxK
MWLVPRKRDQPSASPHQFALYRIALGLTLAAVLGASPAPEIPPDVWLDLPRGVRGGMKFAAVIVGAGLCAGVFRRAMALAGSLIAVLLASYEFTSWAMTWALLMHTALVAFPAPGEPWSRLSTLAPFELNPHWSTGAWLVAAGLITAWTLDANASALGWLVLIASAGVLSGIATTGPKPALAWAMIALLIGSAALSESPFGALIVSILTMLACITLDWIPALPRRQEPAIVFFDGLCGLCDRGVSVILTEDRRGALRVAALQGETSRALLNLPAGADYETMVVYEDGKQLHRSDGATRIAQHLGGIWRVAALLGRLPRPIRDRVYDWVARNRYDWFGARDTCRVPTASERERFLA